MDYTQLKKLLQTPQKVVVVPHKNPDGDAMGSTLAMQQFLSAKGHQCTVVAPNSYPDFLKWMPEQEQVVIFDQQKSKGCNLINEATLIFTLDFNALSRTDYMQAFLEEASATFVMIDHHRQPDNYAAYMYSDVSASSTCELVYNFIVNLGEVNQITPEIASCLYAGIMTDTGSFRFASTTGHTHRVVADLIDKGAQNARIHQNIFDSNSPNQLKLLSVALNNLKVIEPYHAAYITLSQEELDAHHFKKGDTEGFVNYGLSIKGIKLAAIFIENAAEKIIKISLRSKDDFDVNTMARTYFNGGGHLNAAGGRSEMSLTETTTFFERLLEQHAAQLK